MNKIEYAGRILLSIFLMVFICMVGIVFYQYERIVELEATVDDLSERVGGLQDIAPVVWSENNYNYLAIGNSITVHGEASYWWDDDRGMAASTDDKDYVHVVTRFLESKYKDVCCNTMSFATFETHAADREEFLILLDPYLTKEINLVTIQLGENVSDLATWGTDFESVIVYIKEKAQNAKIIVVGDFWSFDNRDELKKEAAYNQNVEYVSLDGIRDNEKYFAGIGREIKDDEGNIYIVDHDGVARHPGDEGMVAIAERIIAVLEDD